MKVFLLMLLMIDNDGNESLQKVSSHNTYLSCKTDQASYRSIKNKIVYYCVDELLVTQNNTTNKKSKL